MGCDNGTFPETITGEHAETDEFRELREIAEQHFRLGRPAMEPYAVSALVDHGLRAFKAERSDLPVLAPELAAIAKCVCVNAAIATVGEYLEALLIVLTHASFATANRRRIAAAERQAVSRPAGSRVN